MEILKLTEKAQKQALTLLSREDPRPAGLRVAVIGGGCSGLQYKIGWDDPKEEDFIYEYENGLKVFVDPKSSTMLTGASMEYNDTLQKAGFDINNPNATGCCGCGKSFQ